MQLSVRVAVCCKLQFWHTKKFSWHSQCRVKEDWRQGYWWWRVVISGRNSVMIEQCMRRVGDFWATVVKLFALCYGTIVGPVSLSVCDVGVLWPNGWMD